VPPPQVDLPLAPLVVLVALLGLAVGSFLNVVIWRVPRRESVVHPRSACPRCQVPIAPRDNIPVVSWLLLRGRGRCCAEPISVRYPLVELGTCLSFGAVAVWTGWSWALPAWLYLAAVSIALALIDIDCRRLPDVLVKPSYLVLAVLLGAAALLVGEPGRLVGAGVGAAAMFGLYFLMVFIYPQGMGWGDVKLSGVLGLALGWLGWAELIVGSFAGFLVGGAVSAGLLLTRRISGRKAKIPYGPCMIIGFWIGAVWAVPIATWYLALAGLSS